MSANWESNKIQVCAVVLIPSGNANQYTFSVMNQIFNDPTIQASLFDSSVQAQEDAANRVLALTEQIEPTGSFTMYTLDLLKYSDGWELNGIPSASLSVAAGRRADLANSSDGVSSIHTVVNYLQLQVPIVVFARAKNLNYGTTQYSQWPTNADSTAKVFPLFRGYVVGSAFSRSAGDAQYILTLAHWLIDMNFSSCLTRTTAPTEPNSFFTPASMVGNTAVFGSGTTPAFTIAGLMYQQLYAALRTDFWGGINPQHITNSASGLKDIFYFLASQDRLNVNQIQRGIDALGNTCQIASPTSNFEALNALNRFEPYAQDGTGNLLSGYDINGYRFGVPLSFNFRSANTNLAAIKIAEEIGYELIESYSNLTMWDKLAGQFHSNYLFSVIPTVDRAVVVPFIPGLQGPAHRQIAAVEYFAMSSSVNSQRALRGVAVMMAQTMFSGTAQDKMQPPLYSIGGWYGTCNEGMIQFKGAPRWLTFGGVPSSALKSAPVGASAINTAVSAARDALAAALTPRQVFQDAKPLWNAFAQALYTYEVLKHRQAQVSGRLRFDIAPGSLIQIEAAEDRYVQQLLGTNTSWMWATVARVSHMIDATNDTASTSFQLVHLRSDTENTAGVVTIAQHPLYNCSWSGCVLIDDPAFCDSEGNAATRGSCQPVITPISTSTTTTTAAPVEFPIGITTPATVAVPINSIQQLIIVVTDITVDEEFIGTVCLFAYNGYMPYIQFNCVISWGDGISSVGTVLPGTQPMLYYITGGHTYAESDTYTLTITITASDGSINSISATVLVE